MRPVGMGFRPKENEIVDYLKRKLRGIRENCQLIPDLDIYRWEPQALFKKYDEMSDEPSDGGECFFFCIRNGSNRMTGTGYWKETRRQHIVNGHDGNPIWSKKIFVYHEGRQPKGRKSHYSMHEYHLFSTSKPETKGPERELVLCRIINREDKITSPDSLLFDPDPVSPGSSATASHLDNIASPQIPWSTNNEETEDVITMEMMQYYELKGYAEPQLQLSNTDQFHAESKGYAEPQLQLSNTDQFHADGFSSSSSSSSSSISAAFDPSSCSLDEDWVTLLDLFGSP